MSVKFKREFLQSEELDLPYNDDIVVQEELVDTSRWSLYYEIIFKLEDKFYKTYYSTAATEQQYESPWEYEKEIECWEVEKKIVPTETWVDVK